MNMRRQQRSARATAQRHRSQLVRSASVAALVVIVAAIAWFGYRRHAAAPLMLAPGEFPGPRGGASQAQDVGTLVGTAAPAFTLPDSEGTRYAITPGRGRPLVLVFHMGIT